MKYYTRNERLDNFKTNWLPILMREFEVEERENGSYTFELPEHGIVDFFPKKNALLIRKKNKWIRPGLKWLIGIIEKL
jgi:hypothetical protein